MELNLFVHSPSGIELTCPQSKWNWIYLYRVQVELNLLVHSPSGTELTCTESKWNWTYLSTVQVELLMYFSLYLSVWKRVKEIWEGTNLLSGEFSFKSLLRGT